MSAIADQLGMGGLTPAELATFQAAFEADPRLRQSMNAVTTTAVNKVAINRREAAKLDRTFSVHIPENPATSQKHSGRCWMFAALNVFRSTAKEKLNIGENFEFSQNYTMFWDKLEKANYFLENILATLDEPIGSRLLGHLLQSPIQDGGQWDMFVNLIEKYGVVPKTAMPETESSSNTGQMNGQITGKLREYAARLRAEAAKGTSTSQLRELKQTQMTEVYRMLCIHLGEPPTTFDFQWRDKDKGFHREEGLTPKAFYDNYVGINLADMVCLINDPRPGHDFNRLFTVKFLGNVVGGRRTEYLNTDLDTIKQAAIAQLKNNEPVWFGCDVGKYLDRDAGVMDQKFFEFDLVYGTTNTMTKAERLQYGHSQMTHAMVFTGVDLDATEAPIKWRVENSWSAEPGDKGFFQMTDPWFDEFNYEIVVNKKYVPEAVLAALQTAPIELEPWDPMGSLA